MAAKHTYSCALLLLLALLGPGSASPAGAMDLMQAYEAARTYDATVLGAQAAARAGREVLPQARAQLLPTITASFSRARNTLHSETPNFFGGTTEADYTYPSSNDTVTLRQPVYRKYQLSQLEQARAQVQEVEAVLQAETQNLALRVTAAYLEALLAQDQERLVQSQLTSRRANLDAATKQFASGAGTRTDVDDAQARLDLAVAAELEARQHVAFTAQQLRVIVGQPIDGLAQLQPAALKLEPPVPDSAEAWIEKAESANLDLAVLRARLEAARMEVEKNRAGHFPTLDAVVQATRSTSENVTNVESRYENRSVGLQLTIPIYAGGGTSAAVRQALANVERAEFALEAARREIGIRVRKEFRNQSEGLLRIKALEQAERSTMLAVDSTQKSLMAGVRTRLDVLNAQDNLLTTRRDLAQARYVFVISGLRLAALVNEADAGAVSAINALLQ